MQEQTSYTTPSNNIINAKAKALENESYVGRAAVDPAPGKQPRREVQGSAPAARAAPPAPSSGARVRADPSLQSQSTYTPGA